MRYIDDVIAIEGLFQIMHDGRKLSDYNVNSYDLYHLYLDTGMAFSRCISICLRSTLTVSSSLSFPLCGRFPPRDRHLPRERSTSCLVVDCFSRILHPRMLDSIELFTDNYRHTS